MDTTESRIAVVMITYNRRDEVLVSLGHLTALPERPAVILVDNGSADGTAAAVAAEFPQVRIINAGGNLGAAGRTLGVRHVATPYVAFADDDSWWAPGSLTLGADLLDRHPKLAVLTGKVLIGAQNREDPVCAEMAQSPLPAEPDLPGYPILGLLARASLVRRSAFLDAGGFPERVGLGGEEEWLAVELAARGWKLRYLPDLVVHHHPSRCRDVNGRRWRLVRNALWFAWLRRPLLTALARTAHLVRSRPWDRALICGFAAALAGLPRVLRQRRVLPREVEKGLRLLDRCR